MRSRAGSIDCYSNRSVFQSTTRVKPFICTMPMRLDDGWNQIQFNLSDFTRRAYGTNYVETLRVQIHANCRIRRIYFSDRLYSEDELPSEFKLFLPIQVCVVAEIPTASRAAFTHHKHVLLPRFCFAEASRCGRSCSCCRGGGDGGTANCRWCPIFCSRRRHDTSLTRITLPTRGLVRA